ncbi:MAG: hypothetical protein RLZZ126_1442 [Pseudomonadota bacterium]|jgi:hypothetical protein
MIAPPALTAKAALLTLLASLTLSACSGDSWREEVLLHDGQKIVVERSQTYKGRSEIGQPTPIGEHTVKFTVPATGQKVTWTSEYGEDLGRTNFNLLAVHVLKGTPYVVATPNLCLAYNKWGRPNPPYVYFKHDGKTWQRIDQAAWPAEFQTVNVVQYIWGYDLANLVKSGLTPANEVTKLNQEVRQPEFKTILRERMQYPPCPPVAGGPKAPHPIP